MRQHCWPAYKRLLQKSTLPIFVGPWTSEVGFEALYWIPFVQALGIDPKRMIPISRGGAAVWYGTPEGIELFDLREPKDLRIETMLQHARTGELKQNRVTAFDRAIIRDAAKTMGFTRYHVLHPSWMYQVLRPFFHGHKGLEWLWPHITREATTKDGQTVRAIDALRAPELPAGVTLPPHCCAVRFYIRATFPHADATIQLARASIRQIAQHQPVILLNHGVHADEHVDIPVKDIPNVITLKELCGPIDPRQNLAIQSAVIARSAGFVGTYGGLAQLALRLGKPSVSYYLNWQGTALAHKTLSEALGIQLGVSFLTVQISNIPLLKAIVPEMAYVSSSGGQQPVHQPAE